MKFITVTLNPALDLTITMKGEIVLDGLNRSEKATVSPGGKGINVSRALCAVGCESDAICLLGGFTGARIRKMLTEEGVTARVIATSADTRINLSIMQQNLPGGTRQCEINNPPMRGETDEEENKNSAASGIRPASETAEIILKVKTLIRRLVMKNEREGEKTMVILAGSIPPDIPKNIYADMIRFCRSIGALTVCDSDGEALRAAVAAHPDYIKPNFEEISSLMERRIPKEQMGASAAELSVTTGGETSVLMTAGSSGAYLARSRKTLFTPAVKVERVRTLKGAGDTFLAAFLYALHKNATDAAALQFAARAASVFISTDGGVYTGLSALKQHFDPAQS